MSKNIFIGVILGLTVMASSCFAQVVERVDVYKGNEIKFPQVVGIDPMAAQKINIYLLENVANKTKAEIDEIGANKVSINPSTKVVRDDDKYLSLLIKDVFIYRGARHPYPRVRGFVFDKTTGNKLPLEYFVNMQSAEQIEERVRNKTYGFYSYNGKPQELYEFTHITYVSEQYTLDNNDNLDLYYQQYQLGGFDIGTPYIRLGKVNSDGIISKYQTAQGIGFWQRIIKMFKDLFM